MRGTVKREALKEREIGEEPNIPHFLPGGTLAQVELGISFLEYPKAARSGRRRTATGEGGGGGS